MATNIYVDTNIVVDMCDNTKATHKTILEYIRKCGEKYEELK